MTCREFAEFIADYLDGELAPDTRALFERHLSRCPDCPRYLERYRQTIALGKAAFEDTSAAVPDDVPEDLVDAILSTRERSSK